MSPVPRLLAVTRRMLLAAPVAAAMAVLPATSASAQPWVFAPATPQAQQITDLFWFTVVISASVFVLVEGLLIYSSLRFRRRAPVPSVEPPQIHGNTRLEMMWAIVPALILIGLFGASVRTMAALQEVPADAYTIEVRARQFAWDFRYPDVDLQTTNELYLPIGRTVTFEITSQDVNHSFWIPNLSGKLDAIPGRVNRLSFQATEAGQYRGVCAELCGAGHAGMVFRVVTLPEADFRQWQQNTKAGVQAAAAAGPDPERGKALFVSKGCVSCHTLSAVPGANGQVGPNLDGVGTRAATRVPGESAEQYLRQSLQDPQAFLVPGYGPLMPQIPMTDDELASMVALLLAQK